MGQREEGVNQQLLGGPFRPQEAGPLPPGVVEKGPVVTSPENQILNDFRIAFSMLIFLSLGFLLQIYCQ